ncbi:MAG: hypothetical protein JW983_06640 [Elusimicrobia bacterium]|nr:hypothetical protein [Elusimicrobiota bacterium]
MGDDLQKKINKMKMTTLSDEMNRQFRSWEGIIRQQTAEINNLKNLLEKKSQELTEISIKKPDVKDGTEEIRSIRPEPSLILLSDVDKVKQESTKVINRLKLSFEQEKADLLDKLKKSEEEVNKTKKDHEEQIDSIKKDMKKEVEKLKGVVAKLQEEKLRLEQNIINKDEQFFEEKVLLQQEIDKLKNRLSKKKE